MKKILGLSALGTSLVVHFLVIGLLWFLKIQLIDPEQPIQLETVLVEERPQEEFTQELETEMEVSENVNPISGGLVSTVTGSATGPTVAQQKIETSETLQEPEIKVNAGEITTPGDDVLGQDLGEKEVTGEIGALVEGYGPALSRMAQELNRLMHEQPIQVVWLFDESESMKDDQEEIKGHFSKIYEELGILQAKSADQRKDQQALLTTIMSYGNEYHVLTPTPTADLTKIAAAINSIPIDTTGKENMCTVLYEVIRKYGVMANRDRPQRKLVVVVVSDESGDDGDKVENVILEAKRFSAPVYFLGREAVFGFPIARYRWQDELGLSHWLPVDRGPESPYRECLQWDGLHRRWDSDRSGFGPYEQVRIARETGGIFFMLPGEEENLAGRRAFDEKKFEAFELRKYVPDLSSRQEYGKDVTGSRFRTEISRVIAVLDPEQDKQLSIRSQHYPLDITEFRDQAGPNFQKAGYAMQQCTEALAILDKIAPLRDQEASDRWRAHYDLIYAQCLSYRVRLFQYMLALDLHMRNNPQPKNQQSNVWDVHRLRDMINPDEEQFERIKKLYNIKVSRDEYLAELKKQEDIATARYQEVIARHPNTPWSRRAQWELAHGFGMKFVEAFRDPRYNRPGIKFPNL